MTGASPSRRRFLAWGAVAVGALAGVLVAVVLALRGDGADDASRRDLLPPAPAPELDAVRTGDYEWQPLPIGGGGFVTGIVAAVDDGERVLYARTDVGGAYRWDDERDLWVQLVRASAVDGGARSADYSVASIAVAPSAPERVLLLVGNDYNPGEDEEVPRGGRVLRSDDGGRSWVPSDQEWFVAGNQSFRTGGERLAIDPLDPDRAYVGTQREGLWRSTDGGATWDQIPLDRVPDGVTAERSADQSGVGLVSVLDAGGASVVVAGVAHEGILVSFDDGESWERVVDLDDGEVPSSATPVEGGLALSIDTPGAAEARLLRLAVDGGEASVEPVPTPSDAGRWNLAASPHDARRLVLTDDAVRDGRLWTSDDAGDTWTTHDIEIAAPAVPWLEATDLDTYMSAGRLVFDPVDPELVWFAEGMGVWRTDDLGAPTITWEAVSRGIEEIVVSSIVVPPGGAPVVVAADRQGFRFPALDLVPASTLVDERFASGSSVDYSAGDPEVLAWVGAESNLPRDMAEPRGATSDDGGATWQEMGGMVPEMFGGEVAVSATDPDVLVWVPTHILHPYQYLEEPLGVYVSDDRGRTWRNVRPDADTDAFHRFFWWFERRALAADRVDGRFYLMSDEEAFYVSDDGGSSWIEAPHAPPCTEFVDCHVAGQIHAVPGRPGHVWASTGRGGLHRTEDAGASPWTRVDGIVEARSLAFGAPVPGSDEPVVFVHGRTTEDGASAIWRSVDGGGSWTLVAEHPADLAMPVNALAGDPDVPGRLYVGFGGAGAVVGDDVRLGSS